MRFGAIGRVSRASAAGITWTSRTLKAEWAARDAHTSVIGAAGAIYVIGGKGGNAVFNDVWVSTDGGADRARGRSAGTRGYGWGTHGTSRGTQWGHSGVLPGFSPDMKGNGYA